MPQRITDADGPQADWHDEEWVRRAANLGEAERKRRIAAVSVLLDGEDGEDGALNDVLFTELTLLREALQGGAPKPASPDALS